MSFNNARRIAPLGMQPWTFPKVDTMFPPPRISSPFGDTTLLPRGHGGCACDCHRMPNVWHCIPCCYPVDVYSLDCIATTKRRDRPQLGIDINFVEFDDAPGAAV